MENGHDERLADSFSGLGLKDSSRSPDDDDSKNDSLFQVIKAVEAAEATIKQQVEENNRLRVELRRKVQELEKYKTDKSMPEGPNLGDQSSTSVHGPYEVNQSAAGGGFDDQAKSIGNSSTADPSGTLVVHQHLQSGGEDATTCGHTGNQSEGSMINGTVREPVRTAGLSQFSSPSTTSLSPMRIPMDGERDPHFKLSAHGLMPVAEVNNSNSLWKQDLIRKIQEQEEEILQLKRHLTDYSVKEAQIRNEKYVLEKRIAYMRLAFDQQQQDLVDAASKALSYRQEIIEENIRLTYALQAAQQERSTFVSSLVPLLAEYSLQPQVSDAQSIVSSVKVLFRHLQEKLLLTESKLKESEYQLAPWRSDMNQSNIAPMSPVHSVGTGLTISNKNAFNLMPQQQYSHAQAATDWDLLHHHEGRPDGSVGKNLESDEPGRYLPLSSRNPAAHEMSERLGVNQDEIHGERSGEANKKVKFHEPLSNTEMNEVDADSKPNTGEPSYASAFDDPSSSNSPYLQPVFEDPSSSYSEAGDDDPLPAIDGLQIAGEAFPGRELQACGYSINGTTSCNFEWVRHLEDGSVNYIDGAKQPNYLVSADDVDTYLAIEVQPLDDGKRKGELVKVFANEQRKITCDPEMQSHIEKTFNSGHASYKVSIACPFNVWEPATLSIKREGYSIKRSSGLAITEKFSPSTMVAIPYGQAMEFGIIGADGIEHHLRVDKVTTEECCSRDTIVLTLRLFSIRAMERRKGKKKGFLFNK